MAQAPTGHVYRMRWWFRGLALFFLAFCSVLFTDKALQTAFASEDRDFTKLALILIVPAVGAGMTAKSLSSTVKFTESTVERRSMFGFQNVSLAAIRGRREYVVRGNRGAATRYLRLVATDNSFVDFGKSLYTFDDVFWVWFRELPDLDAEDANGTRPISDSFDTCFPEIIRLLKAVTHSLIRPSHALWESAGQPGHNPNCRIDGYSGVMRKQTASTAIRQDTSRP